MTTVFRYQRPPEKWSLDETDEDVVMQHLGTDSDIDLDFEPHMSGRSHLTTQSKLNDLVRDLRVCFKEIRKRYESYIELMD
ncbi:hypothetical protein CHS0354_014143 [Potamilus streckersoni]|uniref:Uncharacterized protein n=1 Tax=Potamilus streckersoni TaxID=2493646 RepID=A0AAE0WEK5_9BIVA|nr:hypothetical protein CHS0354_014143 [Potamilus streckersoni]